MINAKQLFLEVQAFLTDKKPKLDDLVIDMDKFVNDTCKDLDIPIWEEKDGGKTHTEEYLIVRTYVESRIAGEIQYRMVFISFGTDITK